jgi:hypothetical protein
LRERGERGREGNGGVREMVGLVVREGEVEVAGEELRERLQEKLPGEMVPDRVVEV